MGDVEKMSEQKPEDDRAVFFFDIDNCLYPKSKQIFRLMADLIDKYFETHLSLSPADATLLHQRYYKDYGLAIEGLVRHHKVDPLAYNAQVDDALPLEKVLHADAALRALLQSVDTRKARLWLFTNAYETHGRRVVRLLGVDDVFEGITFCDYAVDVDAGERFACKPAREMYVRAMRDAGLVEGKDEGKCYFVDDSADNVRAAWAMGWNAVQLVEGRVGKAGAKEKGRIGSLEELKGVFPHLFREGGGGDAVRVTNGERVYGRHGC